MRPVLAHGFGQGYDLPLPLWLYLYGAAAAVLLSFLPLALLSGKRGRPAGEYPRLDLLRVPVLRGLLGSRLVVRALRLTSVAVFGLVVAAGLFGVQGGENVAPVFVWAVWWVGFSLFVAFVGNLWPVVNPWKILFGWVDGKARRLGRGDGLWLGWVYPESLGVWPAVAFYLAFIWFENVFADPGLPRNVALAALLYSLVTFYGMASFGGETWLRRGEAFSVFFGLLGGFAPMEARVKNGRGRTGGAFGCAGSCPCFARAAMGDRELNLRPFGVGLGLAERAPPGGVPFVVLVLAGVTYDGLLETPIWVEVVRTTPLTQTTGLLLTWAAFLGVYLGCVWLCRVFGGERGCFRGAAAGYVLSVVPIAVAYQVAHYGTFLLVGAQKTVAGVSDPFGWGWDLLGTAALRPGYGLIGAGAVWYAQAGLIVAGHVVAVWLAHRVTTRLAPRHSVVGQLPMLSLMVLYTVFGLWILAQPIVE
ncbi:hypothetical protein GBA63_16625 [Rubrobacter tropicus]|uniref:Fenitrothion hydrolase n=1 Tax=Rubrobacter tropicus TaxID=2653851 RepID=A0A6G8QCU9_9ACTN|nr:hypothetical protein [Rubrobacter tropicus]QIN84087.1 hypothetical protein GBA63_16625 [Rubrobacter tropicus]